MRVKPIHGLVHERDVHLRGLMRQDSLHQAHRKAVHAKRVDHCETRRKSPTPLFKGRKTTPNHVLKSPRTYTDVVTSANRLKVTIHHDLQMLSTLPLSSASSSRRGRVTRQSLRLSRQLGKDSQGDERRTKLTAGILARTSEPINEKQTRKPAGNNGKPSPGLRYSSRTRCLPNV